MVSGSQESDKPGVRVKDYHFWLASSPEMDHAQAHLQLMRGIASALDHDRAIQTGELEITSTEMVVPLTWEDEDGTAHIEKEVVMYRVSTRGVLPQKEQHGHQQRTLAEAHHI